MMKDKIIDSKDVLDWIKEQRKVFVEQSLEWSHRSALGAVSSVVCQVCIKLHRDLTMLNEVERIVRDFDAEREKLLLFFKEMKFGAVG